jgi:hypothetical protein
MHRITSLPAGGADRAGRDVWFSLQTEAGDVFEFSIQTHQFESFVWGLRRFAHSAEQLLKGHMPDIEHRLAPFNPALTDFEAFLEADRTLNLSLRDADGVPAKVRIPQASIKSLLKTLVIAIEKQSLNRPGDS